MPTTNNDCLVIPGVVRGTESVKDNFFNGTDNLFEGKPDLFTKLYPPVGEYDPDNVMSVFANGRVNANKPVASKEAKQILTGVYSFDQPVIELQRYWTNLVDDNIKPELDEDNFTLNGLHQSVASVRTVSGYPQLPVSALPRSNAAERKHLGLSEKMTSRQREIAQAVWREVWGNFKPSAINIPKKSATGPSRNTNDHVYKLNYCLGMLANNNVNNLLRDFGRGDLGLLHTNYEVAPIMGTNVRWQVDNPGKVREAWRLIDCVNETSPEKVKITTKVVLDGNELTDFAAMRTRLVNAGPWTVNWLLQIFATGTMYAMFERFPLTWHRDEKTIDSDMEGRYLWMGDVSSYDHSFSEEQLDLSLDTGREFISGEIMDMASSLYYSAYFTRPLGEGDRPTVVGDPLKFNTSLHDKQIVAGNRSGHAFTSLFAKVWKVIETLTVFDKMGYDVITDMSKILKGDMPLGMINNGDDEICWFKTERDYKLFDSLRTNPQPDAMFKVSREVGAVFSGSVYQKVGHLKYKAVERLTTPFQRILCPERSIGGNFRAFWPIGIIERHNKRDSHPVLAEMWSMFDHSWRKIAEPHYGTFLGIVQRAHELLPFDINGLSWKDVMVLEDASKMHHRFTPDEISERVLESSFSKLQPQFFMHVIEEHYSGNLV